MNKWFEISFVRWNNSFNILPKVGLFTKVVYINTKTYERLERNERWLFIELLWLNIDTYFGFIMWQLKPNNGEATEFFKKLSNKTFTDVTRHANNKPC